MMRKLWIAALLMLPTASLGDETLIDGATVEACFARDDAQACIGDAANQCQDTQPQGQTTLGISECLMAEHAAWDRILNREYGQLRDNYADDAGLVAQLRDAQRAWITFRDADCRLAYDRYGGGSMRVIAAAGCRLQHTARRALDLRDMQGM